MSQFVACYIPHTLNETTHVSEFELQNQPKSAKFGPPPPRTPSPCRSPGRSAVQRRSEDIHKLVKPAAELWLRIVKLIPSNGPAPVAVSKSIELRDLGILSIALNIAILSPVCVSVIKLPLHILRCH